MTSFLTRALLLDPEESSSTSVPHDSTPSIISSVKSCAGRTSRGAIQHEMPSASSPATTLSALSLSSVEWLMNASLAMTVRPAPRSGEVAAQDFGESLCEGRAREDVVDARFERAATQLRFDVGEEGDDGHVA